MIKQPTYQEYKKIFANRPKPFAFVDLHMLNANIRQVLAYSGDKPIRIGSKSVRCTSILRHILDSDARFNGLLCFTAAEAVWLAQQGFDDLLIAYPTIDPIYIEAVAEQVRAGHQIVLMVDCIEQTEQINHIASKLDVRVPLCLDLDMATKHIAGRVYFGALRSAINTTDQIRKIVAAIKTHSHLDLDGVMGYEAQIAGVTDNAAGSRIMNRLIRYLKKRSIPQVAGRRAALVDAITEMGVSLRFVNAGGTGSLKTSSAEPCVTEVTAGSAFYCPTLFSSYADYEYYPAAGFAIEVVRQPAKEIYTCLGGGYIASGTAKQDRLPQPYLLPGATLHEQEGAGEVQTPIMYQGDIKLELGSPVFMRHAKAGELCERFNKLYLVSEGTIVDTVNTYRGEGQSFL